MPQESDIDAKVERIPEPQTTDKELSPGETSEVKLADFTSNTPKTSAGTIKKRSPEYKGLLFTIAVILIILFFICFGYIKNFFFTDCFSTDCSEADNSKAYLRGSLFIAFIIGLLIWFIPKRQVKKLEKTPLDDKFTEFEREKERLTLEDDTRKTLAQIVGGVFILIGLFVTYNTYRLGVDNFGVSLKQQEISLEQQKLSIQKQDLDRRGQITERFNKAVEHLGNQDLAVRLGGLYALEQILKDSPEEHQTIIEVVSAYVREKGKRTAVEQKKTSQANSAEPTTKKTNLVAIDIQTALTILVRRPKKGEDEERDKINLRNADLTAVDLSNANFIEGDLNNAVLSNANLSNSFFNRADLSNADVRFANLNSAQLYGANLSNADLSNAMLDTVGFNEADLSNANLSKADLSNASFGYANLTNANLSNANLKMADFRFANLSNANLNNADISKVDELYLHQLEQAKFDNLVIDEYVIDRETVLRMFREKQEKKEE